MATPGKRMQNYDLICNRLFIHKENGYWEAEKHLFGTQ